MGISFAPGESGVKTSFQSYPYSFMRPGPLSGSYSDYSERAYKSPPLKGSYTTLPGGTKFRTSTYHYRASCRMAMAAPAVMSGYAYLPAVPNNFYSGTDISYAGFFLNLAGFSTLISPEDGDIKNEAVTKAMNKIADQKVNLGENLATLNMTYKMFASKVGLLRDALVSGYRNKSLRPFLRESYDALRRRGVSRSIAESYLEYIYGLKPLMSDIYELVQTMKHGSSKTLLLKGVGTAMRSRNGRTHNDIWSSGYATCVSKYAQCDAKAKCTLWARLDPNASQFRAMNQLGLLNPLSLAYELTPWSFVVDWFIPIGPVLSALTAPAGLIFVDGSISYRISQTDFEQYCPDRFVNDRMPIQKEKTYGQLAFQKEVFQRDPLGGWPMPGLYFDGNPMRGDRGLKALALGIANLAKLR